MPKSFNQYSNLDLLLESGIFDRYWYSAQSDRFFSSEQAAAEDYLVLGMSKEMSPHPLMDVRSWPGHLRTAWKDGQLDAVLRWFRGPLESQPPLGPLLVPRMLNTRGQIFSSEDVASHAGGTLGWLLEHAPDDYVVDFPEGQWVWGNVLSSKTKIVDTIKIQTYKSRRRVTAKWDNLAEDLWRKKVDPIGMPSSNDGEPLVSIIMPAWNRADVIAKAIRSVQRQTTDLWELIVVDDGSTDATRDVVRLLTAADPRISLNSAEHGGV